MYTDSDLARWDAHERVHVSQERIHVSRFTGSILWAHLTNARAIAREFPRCGHVVLQASNMVWVRRGLTAQVRKRGASIHLPGHFLVSPDSSLAGSHHIVEPPTPEWSQSLDSPIMRSLMAPRNIATKQQHEGSFFHTGALTTFASFLDDWAAAQPEGNLSSLIIRASFPPTAAPEEVWLQTWLLNFRRDELRPPPPTGHLSDVLCLFPVAAPEYYTTREEVRCVRNGRSSSRNGRFLAVKRVARDLEDPITRFAMLPSEAEAEEQPSTSCAVLEDGMGEKQYMMGQELQHLVTVK